MRVSSKIWRSVGVAAVVLWSLFPIYWTLNTSLMTQSTSLSVPAHFLPIPLTFSNYAQIFGASAVGQNLWPQFSRSLINIIVETVGATILTITVSTFAAYGFARISFRFKRSIFYLVLATMALPAYATLIPLYRIMSNLQMINTYSGIILVYASGFVPLATWILYGQFSAIPRELEEAAVVDGCSRLQTLFKIMIPVALPGIVAAAIISFLFGWGQFLFPLVLSTDLKTQPLTIFITTIAGNHLVPYTLLNATGFLAILVPALIVIFLNRYLIRGILAGSIK